MNDNQKIDFVITWVDGSDPKWLEERRLFEDNAHGDFSENRFRDWGLLKYWFRGVEKFAPWVNKIHFVTWGHIPDWLNIEHSKLNIVKHSDFIPQEYLPTFNSNAIELNLHRIRELSENFVYFNDDMFLLRNVNRKDFFINNLPCDSAVLTVLQPTEKLIDYIIFNNMVLINKYFIKNKFDKRFISLKYGKYNAKSFFSLFFTKYSSFNNFHCHINLNKKILEELWNKEPDLLHKTSMSKFRSKNDINIWLVRYWQIAKGDFVISKVNDGYYEIDEEIVPDIIKNQKKLVICLNDVISHVDIINLQKRIIYSLDDILPIKSNFEK